MFSPEASTLSARNSLRNPRRRPRNSDGPQQVQPRRKRSKLGDEAFVPVGDDTVDGNGNGKINGHVSQGSVESSLVLVDMPVREKKGTPKRAFKEDIALYLNKNENYSVKKLSNFPSALAGATTPFQASALPVAGLALALTTDQALVWDYAGTTGGSKVLTLPLPPALKGAGPLPLGEIVRNGPTNDFGIVAVAPSTGRIVFWENIDTAEARSHFSQRKQGVEGAIKLYSGERITQLVDVDHAGYILVLSSGRLAQLTLRDAQGRPCITTTVLNTPNGTGSSFFSFKGLLGSGIRKTIASVKARSSDSKGQMEIIAATRSGLFQLWNLSWSGQQIFKHEIDARENMLSIVQQGIPPETRGQQNVEVLDCAIMSHAQKPGVANLLVLIALTGRDMLDHFLLEVDLAENEATVSRAIPLRNYHPTELPKEATGTLLLPNPGHTALALFPDAVVVASLAEPEESPEAQLFSDSGSSVLPFQDCIYFKSDAHVRIAGQTLEPAGRKNHTSSALVFVQDYGMLQINAYAPATATEQDLRSKVTARSKLVQATFFSTVPGTILDFATKGRYSFSQDDVEKAALDISAGVLSSSFEPLEGNTLLLEDQLRKRALALQTLNSHLRSQYPDLSFLGRWHLLWHAEKLAAAINLWSWYQKQLRKQELRPEAYPEKNVMGDIIMALHEKYKTPVDATQGEKDPIRQFFLKDINSLEIMLPWTWNYFRLFYIAPERTKPMKSIMQRLDEIDHVLLTALETGFSFRKDNIERYGLDEDLLDDDGILKPGLGYDKLPNFWTSTYNLTNSIRSIVDAGCKYADDCYEQHEEEVVAQEVAQHNPRLVRINCQNHIERFRWGMDQNDEKRRQMGKILQHEWDTNVRPNQIYHLASIGLASEGMNLAERYSDMPTLVDIIWDESRYLEEAQSESQGKMLQTEINLKLDRINKRVAHCFEQYKDFATAYFSKYIAMNKSGLLLKSAREEKGKVYQASLTKFLRLKTDSCARLRWINDVQGHKQYDFAAVGLEVTQRQETNAWCNSVELSVAKLSLMAYEETDSDASTPRQKSSPEQARQNHLANAINCRLEVAQIQEQLYDRLLPVITTAMDEESAVQLLMSEYGQGRLVDRHALQLLLEQGFEQLVRHRVVDPCLLIDVLTLMACKDDMDPTVVDAWNPFALALQVLALSWFDLQKAVRPGLVGLIWKRLLLQDDWVEINSTRNISSETMTEFLGRTVTGCTLKSLLGLMEGNPKLFGRFGPPQIGKVFGAGCTDGELAVRFSAEDIRQPLIEQNLMDEAEIKALVDKHRLENWFDATCKAAKEFRREEKSQRAQQAADSQRGGDKLIRRKTLHPDAGTISESVEPVIGGDIEDGQAALDAYQDVDMQGQ